MREEVMVSAAPLPTLQLLVDFGPLPDAMTHSLSSSCQAWQPTPEPACTRQLWGGQPVQGAACATVLIAWLKACGTALLITVIDGFNLLSRSDVLSLCRQSSAPVSAPPSLLQQVATQALQPPH